MPIGHTVSWWASTSTRVSSPKRQRRCVTPSSTMRSGVDAEQLLAERRDDGGGARHSGVVGRRRLALDEPPDVPTIVSVATSAGCEDHAGTATFSAPRVSADAAAAVGDLVADVFGVARAPKCTYSSPVGSE